MRQAKQRGAVTACRVDISDIRHASIPLSNIQRTTLQYTPFAFLVTVSNWFQYEYAILREVLNTSEYYIHS